MCRNSLLAQFTFGIFLIDIVLAEPKMSPNDWWSFFCFFLFFRNEVLFLLDQFYFNFRTHSSRFIFWTGVLHFPHLTISFPSCNRLDGVESRDYTRCISSTVECLKKGHEHTGSLPTNTAKQDKNNFFFFFTKYTDMSKMTLVIIVNFSIGTFSVYYPGLLDTLICSVCTKPYSDTCFYRPCVEKTML